MATDRLASGHESFTGRGDRMAQTGKDGSVAADAAILSDLLGAPLPAAEAAMWATMSEERRKKAVRRMEVLRRWNGGEGDLTAVGAAAAAGVGMTRFFEMAKAWEADRSLAALGTFAKSSRRLDPREVALRQIVAKVLGPDPNGSVRRMAMKLGEAHSSSGGEKVGLSMLRRVVEFELRRRDAEGRLGADIQFDCAACSILRRDDTPYTLFAILDRGSQLVLGAALGDVADSSAGYAEACRDALRRLAAGEFDDLPWAGRVVRMELVAGLDADRWANLRPRMAAAGVSAPVEPSTRPGRFGRYLRSAVGERLGLVDMWYGRTIADDRAPKVSDRSPRLGEADARAFLAAQIDSHDEERMGRLETVDGARSPDDVGRALRLIAEG